LMLDTCAENVGGTKTASSEFSEALRKFGAFLEYPIRRYLRLALHVADSSTSFLLRMTVAPLARFLRCKC
jgi:hypothetical protein